MDKSVQLLIVFRKSNCIHISQVLQAVHQRYSPKHVWRLYCHRQSVCKLRINQRAKYKIKSKTINKCAWVKLCINQWTNLDRNLCLTIFVMRSHPISMSSNKHTTSKKNKLLLMCRKLWLTHIMNRGWNRLRLQGLTRIKVCSKSRLIAVLHKEVQSSCRAQWSPKIQIMRLVKCKRLLTCVEQGTQLCLMSGE